MTRRDAKPKLPNHPAGYQARDIVRLWSSLDATGQLWMVTAGLATVQKGHVRALDPPYLSYEEFTGSKRSPTVPRRWRRKREGVLEFSIDSVAAVDRMARTLAIDKFLRNEPVLWRCALPYGHFAIGGRERRIVVIGVASETHYNGLYGEMRSRLEQLILRPPNDATTWRGEVGEPEWSKTDRWLDDALGGG